MRKIFSHEGIPNILVTDNGTNFTEKNCWPTSPNPVDNYGIKINSFNLNSNDSPANNSGFQTDEQSENQDAEQWRTCLLTCAYYSS
ncbi:unnamed protein product [Schistosoma mattheei]|uniref:Uncharacterized protein n=1 Tax=Schistosoma mattheei TaxID=31246 RepID=A0A183PWP3_9TREM|nr:unnamed protein product [Schistosoma mattheei]